MVRVGNDQNGLCASVVGSRDLSVGTEIVGGMWDTDRLYRTRTEAIRDIEDHAIKMGLLPISWSTPDEKLTIGRTRKPGDDLTYVVLVRSARLPDDM